jgi:hypothetical protein
MMAKAYNAFLQDESPPRGDETRGRRSRGNLHALEALTPRRPLPPRRRHQSGQR